MNDIFELQSVLNWARTIDPNEEYVFISSRNCLLAQYLKHKGFIQPSIGGWGGADAVIEGHRITIGNFEFENVDSLICEYPRTFGAFVKRAERKLL